MKKTLYGYSVEKITEEQFISRVFALKPIKQIAIVNWNTENSDVLVSSQAIAVQGKATFGSLREFEDYLKQLEILPKDAELDYFESLDKKELVNPF